VRVLISSAIVATVLCVPPTVFAATRVVINCNDSGAGSDHGLLNRAFDQRGPGSPRLSGAHPDIGAIER
jgi:hypothetical protein